MDSHLTRAVWAAKLVPYLVLGMGFGIVLSASQVISWYRIQEMFRFQSFHMYGIIGSAVFVAAASLWALRRFGAHDIDGHAIAYQTKQPSRYRYWLGGGLFGMGWGLTGHARARSSRSSDTGSGASSLSCSQLSAARGSTPPFARDFRTSRKLHVALISSSP